MPLDELISQLELDGVRADTVQLFVDQGTVVRPTAPGEFDPDTESVTPNTTIPIYSGECSIYPMEARRDTVDVLGEGLIYIRQYRVILPWTADDIKIRDIFTPTVSDDPQIVGREFEVRDVFKSSNLGYRRLTVHETEE